MEQKQFKLMIPKDVKDWLAEQAQKTCAVKAAKLSSP